MATSTTGKDPFDSIALSINTPLVEQYIQSGYSIQIIVHNNRLTSHELRLLLQKKPELLKDSNQLFEALRLAIYEFRRLDYVKLLVEEFDVDISKQHSSLNGATPLCYAAVVASVHKNSQEPKDMVRYLIEHGANVHLKCVLDGWFNKSPLEKFPDIVGPIWEEYLQKRKQEKSAETNVAVESVSKNASMEAASAAVEAVLKSEPGSSAASEALQLLQKQLQEAELKRREAEIKAKDLEWHLYEAIERAKTAGQKLVQLPGSLDPQNSASVRTVRLLGRSNNDVHLVEVIDSTVLNQVKKSEQPLYLAMKSVKLPPVRDPRRDELIREMYVQKECLHENLLPLRHAVVSKDIMYLFMPVMHSNLSEFIMDSTSFPDDSSYKFNVSKVVLGIAKALHYLQTGMARPVVHCDIKPANVLISFKFYKEQEYPGVIELTEVRVADMGGAKAEHSSIQGGAISYAVVHSHHYSAPEQKVNFQLDRNVKVDHKADVYSFGILLGELLARQQHKVIAKQKDIFKVENHTYDVNHFAEQFDDEMLKSHGVATALLIDLYRKCTSVQPEKRPTMGSVLRALTEPGNSAFEQVDFQVLKAQHRLPLPDSHLVQQIRQSEAQQQMSMSISGQAPIRASMTPQEVSTWLLTIGLPAEAAARYAQSFLEQDIGEDALVTLTEANLKDELGVTSLGHRKSILAKVKSLVGAS